MRALALGTPDGPVWQNGTLLVFVPLAVRPTDESAEADRLTE